MKHGRVVLVAVGTETRGNVSDGPLSRSPSHTHQVHAHSRYKPLSALFSPDAPHPLLMALLLSSSHSPQS